jgi:hypothetical protein
MLWSPLCTSQAYPDGQETRKTLPGDRRLHGLNSSASEDITRLLKKVAACEVLGSRFSVPGSRFSAVIRSDVRFFLFAFFPSGCVFQQPVRL